MLLTAAKAEDKATTLGLGGNTIALPRDRALAVRNTDDTFTLIHVGKTHAWDADITEEDPFVVPVPRITVPEIGHLMKLEKLLPRNEDEFEVRFPYSWKGDAR